MRKVISKDIQDNADTYIGRTGEIWISEDNTQLRVGDDTTPGGVEIGVGSASSLVNGNASVTVSPDGVVTFPDGGALTIPNPIVPDVVFDTPGTYEWICPPGVTSVSVVCVGGGAGGSDSIGDGSQGGGDSWFISPSLVAGLGAPGYSGEGGGEGGGYVGDGGGNGGRSGSDSGQNYPVGGGGAGGYIGNGGNGANVDTQGSAGDGGGGGGGGGEFENTGGGGGGVGLYGIGQSGVAGTFSNNSYSNFFGSGGGGGSGGQAGGPAGTDYGSAGGLYGGGGGSGIDYWEGGGGGGLGWKSAIAVVPGQTYTVQVGAGGTAYNTNNGNAGHGGHGAVRIIWGGSDNEDFSFPYNAGYSLTLDQNGLTLPLGATITTNIVEPNNIGPTAAIDIRPYSIDPNQLLRIYSTVNEGNHIHLTSGNLKVTDMYLGDDMQYVRTGTDGNIHIGTNGGENWGGNSWTFGSNGTLYFGHIKLGSPVEYASIAIGNDAAANQQDGISIGRLAGKSNQGVASIAIGAQAGSSGQQAEGVAIGSSAGRTSQGLSAVSIGSVAGQNSQGQYAVAVGALAGRNNQAANSISINATGTELENTTPSSFVIKPVRVVSDVTGFYQVYYNPTTGEMVYYQP